MNNNNGYSTMTGFLAGAFVGAGVALVLAPQSGSETRKMVRDVATRAKDEMVEKGKAAIETAIECGKDYIEVGRERAKGYFETGMEALRGAEKKTARHHRTSHPAH